MSQKTTRIDLHGGYWMKFKPAQKSFEASDSWNAHWNLFRPDGRLVGELEEP